MLKPVAEAMRDSLAAATKAGKLVTPPDRVRPVVYMGLTGMKAARRVARPCMPGLQAAGVSSTVSHGHPLALALAGSDSRSTFSSF